MILSTFSRVRAGSAAAILAVCGAAARLTRRAEPRGVLAAGRVSPSVPSAEIMASARSSMVDLGAQMQTGAALYKSPLIFPTNVANHPSATKNGTTQCNEQVWKTV